MDQQSLNQLVTFVIAIAAAVLVALWLGLIVWTWRDMRSRSRDPIAQLMATLLVVVLSLPGVLVYLLVRPRETLAEAYERSLEEEALLQGIEEKGVCPGCGRPTQSRWQVCPACYTRLKKPCVACGELLELPWLLCPYCATPQPTAASNATGTAMNQPNNGRGMAVHGADLGVIDDPALEYLEEREGR